MDALDGSNSLIRLHYRETRCFVGSIVKIREAGSPMPQRAPESLPSFMRASRALVINMQFKCTREQHLSGDGPKCKWLLAVVWSHPKDISPIVSSKSSIGSTYSSNQIEFFG